MHYHQPGQLRITLTPCLCSRAPGKGGTNVAGVPRAAVVAVCCLVALLLLWRAGTLARLAWACLAGERAAFPTSFEAVQATYL